MTNSSRNSIIFTALVIGAAAVLWFILGGNPPPTPEPIETAQELTPPDALTGDITRDAIPLHPVPESEVDENSSVDSTPLPALDESDGPFLAAAVSTFGADIENFLVRQSLIDKFVATVDNLDGSHVSETIRPVERLPDAFKARDAGDGETFYTDPENYRRYDGAVKIASEADLDLVVAVYHRYYPLFQESYERLGYPNRYFNDRVIQVIDHLLATPQPEEPILLVRPKVLYQYADQELESLSSGQKLLIRMGSVHSATIKQVLRQLRTRLAKPVS